MKTNRFYKILEVKITVEARFWFTVIRFAKTALGKKGGYKPIKCL